MEPINGELQVQSQDTRYRMEAPSCYGPIPLTQPVGFVVVVDAADLARSPTNDLKVMASFSWNGPWQAAGGMGWAQVYNTIEPNHRTCIGGRVSLTTRLSHHELKLVVAVHKVADIVQVIEEGVLCPVLVAPSRVGAHQRTDGAAMCRYQRASMMRPAG